MTRHFKIAMVAACPFPYSRGTPIRIFRMAEALGRRGQDVHVVTYHLGDDVEEAPFRIHRIPRIKTYHKYSPGPTYQKLLVVDSLMVLKLLKVLRAYQFDLIHAHHYEGLLISLLAQKWMKLPIVFDVHTLLESELPFYRLGLSYKVKKWISQFLDTRLAKRASHVTTVTEDIRAKLISGKIVGPENITVIPNGVEHQHFAITPGEGLELHSDTKSLIFTGNMAAYQGIDLLLKAFKEIWRKRQDVRLLIVSNDSFDRYESLASTLGIRGYIDIVASRFDALPKYLAGADVALNPRINCDGIPQKLVNYMAAGKPIVSFAGSAKYLTHGERGLVVENGDVIAFAEATCQLLTEPVLARRLGENARNYVRAESSWAKSAERTEAVYEHVCSIPIP